MNLIYFHRMQQQKLEKKTPDQSASQTKNTFLFTQHSLGQLILLSAIRNKYVFAIILYTYKYFLCTRVHYNEKCITFISHLVGPGPVLRGRCACVRRTKLRVETMCEDPLNSGRTDTDIHSIVSRHIRVRHTAHRLTHLLLHVFFSFLLFTYTNRVRKLR